MDRSLKVQLYKCSGRVNAKSPPIFFIMDTLLTLSQIVQIQMRAREISLGKCCYFSIIKPTATVLTLRITH